MRCRYPSGVHSPSGAYCCTTTLSMATMIIDSQPPWTSSRGPVNLGGRQPRVRAPHAVRDPAVLRVFRGDGRHRCRYCARPRDDAEGSAEGARVATRVEPVLNELNALPLGAGPAPRLPITHHKIVRMIESVRANQ